MIWGKTERIGCGAVVVKDKNNDETNPSYFQHLVCNYAPRGNVEGFAVYKAENTCECSDF